jgi:membrane dipeptidase
MPGWPNCSSTSTGASPPRSSRNVTDQVEDRAAVPVFDGHNDAFLALERDPKRPKSFTERGTKGHLDLPRAEEGGFAGGFFALFTPSGRSMGPRSKDVADSYEIPFPPTPSLHRAQRFTGRLAARLFRTEREAEGRFAVVRTVEEIRVCMAQGTLAAIFHIEGAEAIDTEFDTLEVLHQAGLRSLGPVWSRPNAFGHGVPFKYPSTPDVGPGLTDAGKALVRACNQLGILIDLSHLNEKGFWDVAEISDAPLVATHSNAHALCPMTRNLTDRQLAAIRESDGMVGINFAVSMLRDDGKPDPDMPLAVMVRHLDHLIEHLGEDRVGFGSDFDGTIVPRAIGDAAGLQALIRACRDAGYDEALIRKIAHENWLRVLDRTWHAYLAVAA